MLSLGMQSPGFATTLCPVTTLAPPSWGTETHTLHPFPPCLPDSIVKVYATSLAMLLTTGVSIAFFGLDPSLQLGLGLAVACVSVVLYYVSPEKLALPPGGSVASRALLPK